MPCARPDLTLRFLVSKDVVPIFHNNFRGLPVSAHAIKADGRVHFVDPSVALGLCNGCNVVVLLRGKRLTGTVTGLTCKFMLKTASGEMIAVDTSDSGVSTARVLEVAP
jgi:hypothetical protein